jgi:hypothetical protein
MSLGVCKRFPDCGVKPLQDVRNNKKKENAQMRKTLTIGLAVLAIGSAVPVFAADGFFDRLGDRIDHRLDARGDRINDRLDAKGDRINDRLDARGNRINDRLDALSDKARAEGKNKLAHHLDRKGDRIEARLDRRGDRIENHLDRRGDRIERRLDRRGDRIDHRLDRLGRHSRR